MICVQQARNDRIFADLTCYTFHTIESRGLLLVIKLINTQTASTRSFGYVQWEIRLLRMTYDIWEAQRGHVHVTERDSRYTTENECRVPVQNYRNKHSVTTIYITARRKISSWNVNEKDQHEVAIYLTTLRNTGRREGRKFWSWWLSRCSNDAMGRTNEESGFDSGLRKWFFFLCRVQTRCKTHTTLHTLGRFRRG